MTNVVPALKISVRPSPETNDHEVCLFADGVDLIGFFMPDLMGLDPAELLVEPCSLRAVPQPHTALIARCRCGCMGCSDGEVRIYAQEGRVIWVGSDTTQRVEFEGDQYSKEVERSLHDRTWETPERTAARVIAETIDRRELAARGFEFSWASGRCTTGMMTVSLLLQPGPYQVLVRLPWDGEDVNAIAGEFRAVFSGPPETWPGVECNPQEQGLGPPPFIGSGWN